MSNCCLTGARLVFIFFPRKKNTNKRVISIIIITTITNQKNQTKRNPKQTNKTQKSPKPFLTTLSASSSSSRKKMGASFFILRSSFWTPFPLCDENLELIGAVSQYLSVVSGTTWDVMGSHLLTYNTNGSKSSLNFFLYFSHLNFRPKVICSYSPIIWVDFI